MQPRSPRLRPRPTILTRRRHAVIGTASGLGLLALPIAASVVVVGVTSPGDPTVVATQAAQPTASGNPLVVASTPSPAASPPVAGTPPTTRPRTNVAAARRTHPARTEQ